MTERNSPTPISIAANLHPSLSCLSPFSSWWHLTFNLLVQLAVGVPLELGHGTVRVAAIYLAGVLAGSLGTSVCDAGRQVYLVGASGGVYALLTAHIANVLLNYNHMELGVQRLLAVLLIAVCDAALAVYHRYWLVLPSVEPAVSYAAHLAGGVAGLSLGLAILRGHSPKHRQPLIRYLGLGVLLACALFAVLFNVLSVNRGHQYL
ncbi:Protein rhomboid [Amphibalanus amphitrite]|uniref:Protein rhomboid n=1 Tax=Amphibalanus amphitrite TaxID=1232801 RepID=A0A6A4X8V7_AMPAM|nr:Protein rhomboid [Amphibalanus amphitrite]